MPPFKFTDAQVADLAEFLHGFPVSSRTGTSTIDILLGDPKKGEAYVAAKCASCHTTAALKTFADKLGRSRRWRRAHSAPANLGDRDAAVR
jgi:mono/diheme cytochrome c family protein